MDDHDVAARPTALELRCFAKALQEFASRHPLTPLRAGLRHVARLMRGAAYFRENEARAAAFFEWLDGITDDDLRVLADYGPKLESERLERARRDALRRRAESQARLEKARAQMIREIRRRPAPTTATRRSAPRRAAAAVRPAARRTAGRTSRGSPREAEDGEPEPDLDFVARAVAAVVDRELDELAARFDDCWQLRHSPYIRDAVAELIAWFERRRARRHERRQEDDAVVLELLRRRP